MNTGVQILVIGLIVCIRSANTHPETVWLKDVTTRFHTDKRTLGDPDLPAQLTFHLRRGSDYLVLNLRRNYEINPNADMYVLRKTHDGQSIMKKARNLDREVLLLFDLRTTMSGTVESNEGSLTKPYVCKARIERRTDVAYYQDRENGAYMTVRCVKRSNQQCERVINGNLKIEDSSYDLQPAETTDKSGYLIPDLIGKRYYLMDQTEFQLETLVDTTDEATANATNVAVELKDIFRRFTGLDRQTHVIQDDSTLSLGDIAKLRDRNETDKNRQLTQDYYVKVAVLIDSGVWHLYASRETTLDPLEKTNTVQKTIREAFSHIMNGVNLRYKSIEDPRISISIISHSFIFFESEAIFPHKYSKVAVVNGTKHVEAYFYLYDLGEWDNVTSASVPATFDHAMLFTRHHIYNKGSRRPVRGKSFMNGVCDATSRVSIIQISHYEQAVRTAAHELGHNLGADHDGKGDAKDCNPDDLFIMTHRRKKLSEDLKYIENIWKFSNCSVESFHKKLKYKDCVKTPGSVYNIDEWAMFMTKQAGEVFTPDELCYFVYGPGTKFTGNLLEEICHLLRCKDPATGQYMKAYINAARGTTCGYNKWCIDGVCVAKDLK